MRKAIIPVLAALVVIGLVISPAPAVLADSGPVFFETYVEMRDGALLYTRVYLPDPGIWGPGPYPVILSRTPYGIGTPGSAPTEPEEWPVDILLGYARVGNQFLQHGAIYEKVLSKAFLWGEVVVAQQTFCLYTKIHALTTRVLW